MGTDCKGARPQGRVNGDRPSAEPGRFADRALVALPFHAFGTVAVLFHLEVSSRSSPNRWSSRSSAPMGRTVADRLIVAIVFRGAQPAVAREPSRTVPLHNPVRVSRWAFPLSCRSWRNQQQDGGAGEGRFLHQKNSFLSALTRASERVCGNNDDCCRTWFLARGARTEPQRSPISILRFRILQTTARPRRRAHLR